MRQMSDFTPEEESAPGKGAAEREGERSPGRGGGGGRRGGRRRGGRRGVGDRVRGQRDAVRFKKSYQLFRRALPRRPGGGSPHGERDQQKYVGQGEDQNDDVFQAGTLHENCPFPDAAGASGRMSRFSRPASRRGRRLCRRPHSQRSTPRRGGCRQWPASAPAAAGARRFRRRYTAGKGATARRRIFRSG